MTAVAPLVINMLAEALRPGQVAAPATSLAALEMKDSPLDAIMHTDETGSIEMAIDQDFGFLRLLRTQPGAVDSESKERWTALVRWLLATVKKWKLSRDVRARELAAALLTSGLCGVGTNLWQLLPEECAPSADFLCALRVFVAKWQIVYNFPETASPSIWESEFVEAFQKADATDDWVEIAGMWPRLDPAVRSDALIQEMVRCLARYAFAELVRAADALLQFPSVMEIVRVLSTDQRLRLGLASGSERVRFCCAFTTVARSVETTTPSVDEEATLSELLIKVAAAPEEWRKWMVVFNTYPLRYPPLHRPLGHALARASFDAAVIYVDSIELRPIRVAATDESRSLISVCLHAFSREASLEYRQVVWAYIYGRWLDWRFGAATPEINLFDVTRCPLDFAVVSYAYECMSAVERQDALGEIQKRLSEVELMWYAAETDCTTEWNRLLSLFQPYAHACRIAEMGGDALLDNGIYYPFDLSKSLYHRIMFRMLARTMNPVSP